MNKETPWQRLEKVRKDKGAGYVVLVDPDSHTPRSLDKFISYAGNADVDAFLVGGSFLFSGKLDDTVLFLKQATGKPVILFPGAATHLSPHADALLFLSLISGRNPQFLIEEHVRAAPAIKRLGIEAISTGYMLIGGDGSTAVEFISGTRSIPAGKPELAVAHALAAQYLGMQLLYLESGSGSSRSVPEKMIAGVKKHCDLPVMVGGGITTPEAAASRVSAGADYVVTGNILEKPGNYGLVRDFAAAIRESATPAPR